MSGQRPGLPEPRLIHMEGSCEEGRMCIEIIDVPGQQRPHCLSPGALVGQMQEHIGSPVPVVGIFELRRIQRR